MTQTPQVISSNQLAVERTKLAHQRTYLAYMRTGFSISGIAGKFKKNYLFFFGIFMILTSTYQYNSAIRHLNSNVHNDNFLMDYLPLIYVVLSLAALYLQFLKK